MDISSTIEPRSDQLNAEDLLTGPRMVTVEKVTKGSVEQPVEIHLAEFPGRPFKPSKTVRRILVAAWGKETSEYTGRRMMLYRDPAVRFGGTEVGGVRVSALSHIDKPITLALTVTRGRRQPFTVEPLKDSPPPQSTIPDDLADKIMVSDDPAWLAKTRAYLDKYKVTDPDTVADLQSLIDARTEVDDE